MPQFPVQFTAENALNIEFADIIMLNDITVLSLKKQNVQPSKKKKKNTGHVI